MTTESLQLSFPSLLKHNFIFMLFRVKFLVKLSGFVMTLFLGNISSRKSIVRKFTQVDFNLNFFVECTRSSPEDTSQLINFGELEKFENNHYF